MHDPMTVICDVPNPFSWYRDHAGKLRFHTLATIWHVDPEKDGSDDSCGWFVRARHGDEATLKKIASRFAHEWNRSAPYEQFGWFMPTGVVDDKWRDGEPNYSSHAITLAMFRIAANIHFGHWSRRADQFLRRHVFNILHFAENSCDSICTDIEQRHGPRSGDIEDQAYRMASVVYSWILRAERPWWRHPRWHVHHWKIQIHPLQHFKRWLFSRCCKCGKGFRWGESPTTYSWNGTGPLWFRSEAGVFHSNCNGSELVESKSAESPTAS